MKRIGIDARFYGPLGKGLGRYTKEIVDRIIITDTDSLFFIFLAPENFAEFKIEDERITKVLVPYRWYSLAEQIFFPVLIRKYKLDLMHFCHFNVPLFTPVKFVVTIHDLILTKFPTPRATTLGPIKYWLKNLAYQLIISQAISNSRKIIAVSEFTKQDIVVQFKVDPKKIAMIYEGVFEAVVPPIKPAILNGIADYFLYVGSAYPHKNLELMIAAFADFQKIHPDAYLILVGKEDYFYQRLKQGTGNISNLLFAGYLSDAKLNYLYSHAIAYVFPSLYEGFGLPPLEALAQNCPVLSSSSSCLPEVLGTAALYFNSEDVNDLLAKMKLIYRNSALAQSLNLAGQKQLANYSWDRAAAETLAIYQQLL